MNNSELLHKKHFKLSRKKIFKHMSNKIENMPLYSKEYYRQYSINCIVKDLMTQQNYSFTNASRIAISITDNDDTDD